MIWSHPQTGSMTVGQIILGLIRLESMHCANDKDQKKGISTKNKRVFKRFIMGSFLF